MPQAPEIKNNASTLAQALNSILSAGTTAVRIASAVVRSKKLRITVPNAKQNFGLYSTVAISGSGIDAKYHGRHTVSAVGDVWFEVPSDNPDGTVAINSAQTSVQYAPLGWTRFSSTDTSVACYKTANGQGVAIEQATTNSYLGIKGFGGSRQVGASHSVSGLTSQLYLNGSINPANTAAKYVVIGNDKFMYYLHFGSNPNDGVAAVMYFGELAGADSNKFVISAHSNYTAATSPANNRYWPENYVGSFIQGGKDIYMYCNTASEIASFIPMTQSSQCLVQSNWPSSAASNMPSKDGNITLVPVYLLDYGNVVKGRLPGMYYIAEDCYGLFGNNEIVEGTGQWEGTKFLSVYTSANSSSFFSVPASVREGRNRLANILIDITGNWK